MNFVLNMLVYYGAGLLFVIISLIKVIRSKNKIKIIFRTISLILFIVGICSFTYFGITPSQITLINVLLAQMFIMIYIALCYMLSLALMELLGIIKRKDDFATQDDVAHIEKMLKRWLSLFISGLVLTALAFIIPAFTNTNGAFQSANSINSSYYRNDKKAKMPAISSNDKEINLLNSTTTVRNWAEMSLNKLTEHPSYYKLDKNVSMQYYHGKLVYLIPLHYTESFLEHLRADYIPGYLIIDATTKNAKPQFIKRKMYYSPTHYLNHNVYREMYFDAVNHSNSISNDFTFQIDENATPYYISTEYKKHWADDFANHSEYRTIAVNAVTGKVSYYDASNQPKWLDMCITPEVAEKQLSDYAKYKETSYYAFQFFKEQGKKTSTSGNAIVGYHGKIYYVATLQNYNANQKTIDSYVYIDAKTGKLYQYHTRNNVMTPLTACKTAINAINEKGWQARLPLMYRINGIPTWIITITDDDGIFRKYAYVRGDGLATNDNVAIGDDAQDALTNYLALFNGTSKTISGSEAGKQVVNSGIISKIGRFDDNNIRFKLANSAYVYNISTKQSQNAIFLNKGDHIKVTGRLQNNLVVVTEIKMEKRK